MANWFVRNARDARWLANELGAFCNFEDDDARFTELGINLTFVEPGRPTCMYHHEPHQEGFLVLRGECLLIVEGEEVPLRAWDFFHCPPGVPHVIVGAGGTSALVLAVGSRLGPKEGGLYPVDATAVAHGAGVEVETSDPRQAYARFSDDVEVQFREEFLTG